MGLSFEQIADVRELVLRAGKMAQDLRASLSVDLKSDGSFVTNADRAVERFLRENLAEVLPGSTVWGEEEGFFEPGSAGLWVLDPIDGTTNFRFGSRHWGVSLAYVYGGEILAGWIFMPDLDELYSATLGGGAFRNDVRLLDVPAGDIANNDLVSFGDETLLQFHGLLRGKMRYQGAFVADMVQFLNGVYRGMITDKGALYDVAAGLCLAREIGAEIQHLDGTPVDLQTLMGSPKLPKPIFFGPKGHSFVVSG